MYCSSCGVAVAPGLSYCNYCGAKLSAVKSDNVVSTSPDVKPELLVIAMVACFVFGLVAIAMLMGMMKSILNVNVGVILAVALLSFFIMLLIEGVCIRLLLGRKRRAGDADDTVRLKSQATKELDAAHARMLPEPVSSVTEHTTRAFAPIRTERTSK